MNKKDLLRIGFDDCIILENGKLQWREIRPLDKIIEDLKNHVNYLMEDNQQLENRIEELKNLNKNKEIERLKKMLNQTHNNSVYILTEKQKMEEFKKEHNCHETNRNRYSLIITPNELFTAIEIKCNYCGQSEDLTDWSSI